ncbi:MAG TPA: tetratricopeptide repeat protein [Flavobacterium sp.]|nr:tetratricopeptide repeat protein [Flavobacterium sp.]
MKLKRQLIIFTLLGFLSVPVSLSAQQQEPDAIALENDEFQNNFYESLKQKGIENYDKAIQSLYKCLKTQPENPVIHHELGKNFLAQKNYAEAEKSFQKAIDLDPKQRWYWNGLYDVYYETKDFNRSIPVVEKLISFDKKFQDDLVSLYMYTQQFDKALALINEMDVTTGLTATLEMYKLQILSDAKFRKPEKENLEQAIKNNPTEESNYIQLIYLYSESNQEDKALEVAKKLEKAIPTSDWAQVSLFKFHLNNREPQKAADAMFRVLKSKKIDSKIKHRVLNEFLIFSNNTNSFKKELEQAVDYLAEDPNVNVSKEIGTFFLEKKKYADAIAYFEKSLERKKDDIGTIELLLQAYTDSGQYDAVTKKAADYLDLFPTHAKLYFFAGMAQNQLKNYKKALELLQTGMDFVVEDRALEINLNIQMGEAYHGLGDEKKKENYFIKADQLLKQKK